MNQNESSDKEQEEIVPFCVKNDDDNDSKINAELLNIFKGNESFWGRLKTCIKNKFWDKVESSNEINFIEVVNGILKDLKDDTSVKICRDLLIIHRQFEDTKARKRLERWSKRVISLYLFTVAVILCFNYSTNNKILDIPDTVIDVILTTTTINIIGLVIIVLKGHFYNKSNKTDTK